MRQLKKYLFKTYSSIFFPIFFTFFIITSIIFLIKIATLTSVIQIDFSELLILYGFSFPKILFYILPVTIFISVTLTFSKLSSEYELMVINSLGLNPLKIIKIFVPNLILSSLLLLLLSLVIIPKVEFLNLEFLEKKKSEAQFNINPSEFGQKFGDWFIYVNDKKDNTYKNLVLFKKEQDHTSFIIANSAFITPAKNSNLTLNLVSGKAFNIHDNLKQVSFDSMIINNELSNVNLINTFDDVIKFWQKITVVKQIKSEFMFNIFYAVFPIISILFFLSIGIFNPRYEKNRSTFIALSLITLFVILSHKVSKDLGLWFLVILPSIWFAISYFYYKLRIKDYY